jgi:hypothetical protein
MPQSLKEAAEYSQRWLEIIKKKEVTEAEGKQIIKNPNTILLNISIRTGWNIASPSPRQEIGLL